MSEQAVNPSATADRRSKRDVDFILMIYYDWVDSEFQIKLHAEIGRRIAALENPCYIIVGRYTQQSVDVEGYAQSVVPQFFRGFEVEV